MACWIGDVEDVPFFIAPLWSTEFQLSHVSMALLVRWCLLTFGPLLPPVPAGTPLWRAHQGGVCQSSSQIKKNLGSGNYTSNVEGINIHCCKLQKWGVQTINAGFKGKSTGNCQAVTCFYSLIQGFPADFPKSTLGPCRNCVPTCWRLRQLEICGYSIPIESGTCAVYVYV